jgi:hypothetical protein
VYKIVGGDLAMVKDSSNARFEFRRILDTNEGIADYLFSFLKYISLLMVIEY